jgi:N-formylmaleamate deformylase
VRKLAALAVLVACGHAAAPPPSPAHTGTFTPRTFAARVSGHGRPIIFIPGIACSGHVWDATVAHLGDGVETHVLTLAGFAGRPPIEGDLLPQVR